jgi:hypothetical protein
MHVDGAWATATPQMELQLAFFNDLEALPDVCTHGLNEDGSLGEEVAAVEVKSVERNAEVTVVMNLPTAKRLVDLLSYIIEKTEAQIASSQTTRG